MNNQPILLIHSIHKNLLLKIVCSVYIFLFLGIALPAHHHSDGLDHGDCTFCVVQKQAPVAETAFSLPTVADIIVEAFQSPIKVYDPRFISAFHSRAPPV